jgi:hypothetical protein
MTDERFICGVIWKKWKGRRGKVMVGTGPAGYIDMIYLLTAVG